MSSGRSVERAPQWAGLFTGFLVVAIFLGIALIWIGANLDEGFARELVTGTGVAIGPAALVTLTFRIFLIEDVKREFAKPLVQQVQETIEETAKPILERYHQEVANLDEIREGGIVRCFVSREDAVTDFLERSKNIAGPMVVVGSSLRGVLPDDDCAFAQEIRARLNMVSFVLMHPVVADLRAHQERRRHTEIGQEIIERLRLLNRLEVPAKQVYLRRGTPTCFGIMLADLMLLNPYPYLSAAEHAPCILVAKSPGRSSYIYDTFRQNHFDIEVTTSTEQLTDLEKTASELERNLETYQKVSDLVRELAPLPH